jgi:hypothetical protein
MHNHTTPTLPELYWRLEQINGAIAALERVQQARAQRSHSLVLVRERPRARLVQFHRPSKKPECVVMLSFIPMSA